MPAHSYTPFVPQSQRPGQNAPIQGATGPGVRPGVVSGGAAPGMREEFSFDAQGNRIRRMVPIDQPPATAGGGQNPVSGAGGTGPVVGGGPAGGTGGATGGTGGTPAQNPNQGPIDPVDVVVGRPTLDSFSEYRNAAMEQARRSLDPQWQAAEERFRQDMVGRGLQEGTEAYSRARGLFDRSKTDAYATAQNNAFQQGQAAQQQAFSQNFAESNLANQLLRARDQNNTSLSIAGMNANTAGNAAEIGRLNFLDQLGFNRDQMAQSGSQWDRQFGQSQQQWADQFGMQQGNNDFGQYMAMLGFDRDTMNMNNNAGNTQFNQLMGMFGSLMPQMQGGGGVDYLSALGLNQQGQQQNYQAGVGQANQNNANYAAILASLFCDENAKQVGAEIEPDACMRVIRTAPLVSFTYHGDPVAREFVGTLAQPFNAALASEGAPVPSALPVIQIMDMLGVLIGAVKALDARVQAMESRDMEPLLTDAELEAITCGGTA